MLKTVKTIYCTLLEQQLMFKQQIHYGDNVTLNSKYGIDATGGDYREAKISHFGLGINPQYDSKQFHSTVDRDVYIPAPLFAKKKADGLTAAEEDIYRMKVEKTINGETYIFCFLKEITDSIYDNNVYELNFEKTTKEYGLKTYSPSQEYTTGPITKDCSDGNKPSKFYGVSSKYSITLSASELVEANTATALLYPTKSEQEVKALYEVGFYSGVETTTSKGKKELANCVACLLSPLEPHNIKADGSLNLVENYGSFNPYV